MILVVPAGRPAPSELARRTSMVIDGWDSWVFPIVDPQEEAHLLSGLGLLFTVAGDAADGQLIVRSRRCLASTQIERAVGQDGWRFGMSGMDFIEGFIRESKVRDVGKAEVAAALKSTFDSQLAAVHGLLRSLRLSRSDEFASEDEFAALPAAFRSNPRGSGVRAFALDHKSAWWPWLIGSQDLYDYGEPPCLVRADVGGLFFASDPPVSLRFFDDSDLVAKVGAGGWVDVPAESVGSVEGFTKWARDNVGVAGSAVSATRRPQRGEVDDEPPELHETNFPGWRYRLAARQTLEVSLKQRAPVAKAATEATQLLDMVRDTVLLPLMDAYRSAGGDVTTSTHGALGEPNQMLVSAVVDGDSHTVDTDQWRVAKAWRTLALKVQICDPTGFASGLRWGTTEIVITPTTLTTTAAMPHLALLGGTAPLMSVIERAVAGLGFSVGGASFGRTERHPHWLTLLDETQLAAAGGLDRLVQSGLFAQARTIVAPTGKITWLQATEHLTQFDTAHATRLADFLTQTGSP